ncbi:hypothetical protein B0H13DRAFT_1978805 [Mycena leptocephala]|nr:hypothetical protein B0H13DRAFT_1978805 [Mycena leptocephala]
MQVVRNERIATHYPFKQAYPRNTEAKGLASPSSTTGSGSRWPAEDVSGPASRTISIPFPLCANRPRLQSVASLAGSAKASHYTVRSHTSRMHVMGEAQHSFGKDVAWKEAHYEDPGPLPPKMLRSTPLYPEKKINITPPTPTPHSGVVFHPNNTNNENIAPSKAAMWLLRRSTASASSVSSEYSTASASMIVPETSVPHDSTVTEEFRSRYHSL